MAVEITISAEQLTGFSKPAQEAIVKAGSEFVQAVIDEANRLESSHNADGGPIEITRGMVSDAVVIQRRALKRKQSEPRTKIFRAASSIFSIILGFMYDTESLQNPIFLAFFMLFGAITILLVTYSTIKD